jgi:hypothetical protein
MALPEVDELRHLLTYDPETGLLKWSENYKAKNGMRGKTAGTRRKQGGHIQIRINGRSYAAHRVCWAIAHGAWPVGVIDHINGNPADNRLCNLRDTTHTINAQNTLAHGGYYFCPVAGKYRVRISASGRRKHIGHFDTPEDAQRAYLAAKREMHPESRLNILEGN